MSYAPGAPEQVWAIVGISDGAKLTVMQWWSKADHETQRDPKPCTVWAPAYDNPDGSRMTPSESLLEDMRRVHPDKQPRTMRGYLAEIRKAGLAEIDGRCIDLVPPSESRRKSAEPRQESAGENPPRDGENPPNHGRNPPDSGENPPSYSYPPYPANTPQVPAIISAESAPVKDHPCTVSDSPEATPPRPGPDDPQAPSRGQIDDSSPNLPAAGDDPPTSNRHEAPRPKPRTRKPPDAEPVDADPGFAELLGLHEALRKRAQSCHGLRETPLPGPTSGDGRSLRLRLRKALDAHGLAVCRRALEHQASEWAKDPGACSRWSTDSMWSPKSLAVSIPRSAGQAQARASPNKPRAPTLSCEPMPGEMPRFEYDKNGECL